MNKKSSSKCPKCLNHFDVINFSPLLKIFKCQTCNLERHIEFKRKRDTRHGEILQCLDCTNEWMWWANIQSYVSSNICPKCESLVVVTTARFYPPKGTLYTYNEIQI